MFDENLCRCKFVPAGGVYVELSSLVEGCNSSDGNVNVACPRQSSRGDWKSELIMKESKILWLVLKMESSTDPPLGQMRQSNSNL